MFIVITKGVYIQGAWPFSHKEEAIEFCDQKAYEDEDDYHDWEVYEGGSDKTAIYATNHSEAVSRDK